MRFTFYKNSILATLMSVFGTLFIVIGILGAFTGALPLLIIVPLGIGLNLGASEIAERKNFKMWKRLIAGEKLESEIPYSLDAAIQAYNLTSYYPNAKALLYIQEKNPQAAYLIRQELEKQKKPNKKK